MKLTNKQFILGAFILIAAAGLLFSDTKSQDTENSAQPSEKPDETEFKQTDKRLEHFSKLNPVFRFSAAIPENWQVEYVPELEAINLSDQIFVRYFRASQFLTLQTVNILNRESETINSHEAVRYVIEKKSGVPDFTGQPAWRSGKHTVVDIRFSQQSPTYFYVFGKNPELDNVVFEEFLRNIQFHNDAEYYLQPIDQADIRITKKPFGIYITPETSPVQPDRFTGWHAGTDYEIVRGEERTDVPIYAVCGGELRLKRTAGGYGGVAVQECLFENEPVTVLYGHLDIDSVSADVGEYINPGEKLGLLGEGFSPETDGARKHLHLSIHKGADIDIRGYVPAESQLSAWLDPEETLK